MDSIIGKLRSYAVSKGAEIAYTFIDDSGIESSITFAELNDKASKIAINLRGHLEQGQRVALMLPTSLDYVTTFYGCLIAGLIAVPLYRPTNTKSVQRLTKVIADSQAAVAITTDILAEELRSSWKGEPITFIAASEVSKFERDVQQSVEFELNPIAFLQYTSGSTGDPKGVIISQQNILANIKTATTATQVLAGETFCSWLPLHHDMGMVVSILTPLFMGGHSVIMSPTRFIRRPRRWLEAISHHKAVLTASPNFAFDYCVERITEESVTDLDLSSWRVAINGAEPLSSKSIAAFNKKFSSIGVSNTTIYPAYGMAEATVFVCGGDPKSETVTSSVNKLLLQQGELVFTEDQSNSTTLVSCGAPQEFHDLRIVDPELKNELGELELGEIWFAGPSVSEGYWSNPEATSESFGFALLGRDNYKYLRTGDLGFKYKGELYITGRIKDLIIVKGRNFYPNDLEMDCVNVIEGLSFSAAFEVDGKVVMIHEVGRKFRKNFDGILARQAIRAEILEQHEILIDDINFVASGQLPVTSSGKIQRSLARAMYLDNDLNYIVAKETANTDVAVQTGTTETQIKLEQIWRDILNLEQVSLDDNLFDLGGHSLVATQMVAEIERLLAKKVSLVNILQNPTIASLAFFIENSDEGGSSQLKFSEDHDNRFEPFALTNIQRAYWLGRNSDFELSNIGCHGYYEVPIENFSLERFSAAWNRLIQRHEMLRMVIDNSGVQRILEHTPEYSIKHYEINDVSDQDRSSHFDSIRDEMSHQVFSAEMWPVFDIRVSTLTDGDSIVHYSMDALVLDASSALILENEMRVLYANPEAPLDEISGSFRDYVIGLQSLSESEEYLRAKEYWLARLSDFSARPELPLQLAPSAIDKPRFERRQTIIDDSDWQKLKNYAITSRATPTVFIIACLSKVFDMWSQGSQFTFNLTLFNRNQAYADVNSIIGDFTTTTLLEIDNSVANEGFVDGMKRIQHQLWMDLEHRIFDGLEVQQALKQDHGYDLGFPVVVTSALGLDASDQSVKQNSIMSGVDTRFAITQTPQVWLDIQLYETDQGLCINWDSVTGLFSEGVLDAMSDATSCLMHAMTMSIDAWTLETPDIFPAKQRGLINRVNNTHVPLINDVLHSNVLQSIESYPSKLAVATKTKSLNYSELGARSAQLARQLVAQRNSDEPIAVVMHKGWEQIVAVLGILRSGRAYVPIDAQLPAKRIAVLLDICGSEDVVTTPDCSGLIPATYQCHLVQEQLGKELSEPPIDIASSNSTAYIIFTSGTTGVPKGVEIKHTSALNTVLDINRRFNVTSKDTVLGLSSLSFDLSVYDIFGVLGAGGSLIIPAPKEAKDPQAWAEYIVDHHVTLWNTAPALMNLFSNHVGENQSFPDLRLVMLSGDWIPVDLPARIKEFSPRAKLISLGGATEASIWSIAHEIEEVSSDWVSIPYGKALANQKMMVLHENFSYCPLWVVGDIYISGKGLAEGYWKDHEKTSASFVFDPNTGERLYRTGDKGRLRPCGNIEFLGRVDSQVKIQGHRIELGEIEATVRKNELVKDVLVVARDEPKRLVAYVVPYPGDDTVLIDALRSHLKSRLPDFMVPAVIMTLSSIPLTSNGKIDRSKLPEPDLNQSLAEFIAPQTHIESIVGGIWGELLEVDRVGKADNFFALGGNSLLAMQVKSRLQEEGFSVSVADLFGASNLEVLASRVSVASTPEQNNCVSYAIPEGCDDIELEMLPLLSSLELTETTLEKIISRVPGGAANVQDIYPLASNQLGLFLHHAISDNHDAYVLPNLFSVNSANRFNALISDLRIVMERHDVLRTAIMWRDLADPVQVVCRKVELPVKWLRFADSDNVEANMIERCQPSGHWIDLEQPPLLQIEAARDNHSDRHFVLIKLHHTILDHVGLELIFSELSQLQNGGHHSLPDAPLYRDFVAYSLANSEASATETFFRARLSNVLEPTLPFGLQNIRNNGIDISQSKVALPNELCRDIRSVARAQHFTPAALFHAAWSLVLSACSSQSDVVFGTVLSGRSEGTGSLVDGVGLFLNTLPLRVQVNDQSASCFVRELQDELNNLLSVEQASLALAQRCSAIETGSALFSALMNFRRTSHSEVSYDGLTLIDSHERTNYPFTLSVDDNGEGFDLEVQVDDSINSDRIIMYMRTALKQLLDRLTSCSDSPVSKLSVLPESEFDQQFFAGNDTQVDYPNDACIHELFEQQVIANPDAVAVVFDDTQLSYGELNQRANQLANYLVEQRNVTPDTLVGICVERSLEMIVGIFGILKAGGAYVPLDPAYPDARLAFMLDDSKVATVLTQTSLQGQLPINESQAVVLDSEPLQEELQGYSNENVTVQALTPNQLAYVIYTSGSTGKPKGVLIEHQNVRRLFDASSVGFSFDNNDVWTLFHSFAFDFSVWEIFGALLHGGKLVVVPKLVAQSANDFWQLLHKEQVTVLNQTPSAFAQLINSDNQHSAKLPLRYVVFGGEALNFNVLRAWSEKYGCEQPHLINMYGITETTVHVTYRRIDTSDIDANGDISDIGLPLQDLSTLVLSPSNDLLPIGVAGELHVGGAGLARGYLNRPELSAEKFIDNPFYDASRPNSSKRLYKTGDLVRYLADGNLEYLGRIDHQVKIRGYRIELGEIEHQLLKHDDVDNAVVVALSDEQGDKRLVAYVAHKDARLMSDDDALRQGFINGLKDTLADDLPDFMVPSAFAVLSELPLTTNGKVDRKALPAPDMSLQQKRYVAPTSEIETQLCEVWQEALGIEKIGITDNFFELGGHSLLATRVIATVNGRLNVDAPLKRLFKRPTVAEFCSGLLSIKTEPKLPKIKPVSRENELRPSFSQQRLWLLDKIEGGSHHYNMSAALHLIGTLDNEALTKAINTILGRHESLRTSFIEGSYGEPIQTIHPLSDIDVPITDISSLADKDEFLNARIANEANTAFDLSSDTMLRAQLVKLSDDEHVLLVTMHHIASDGWSMGLIVNEFSTLYSAYACGEGNPLPALEIQYADYAQWQRDHLQGELLEDHAAYWEAQLFNLPVVHSLPLDRARPAAQSFSGSIHKSLIDETVNNRLKELCQQIDGTLFMGLHAAFSVLLSRYSNETDIVVGSPIANREQPELANLIGFFMNTLVLRCDLSENPSFSQLLARSKASLLDAYSHQQMPFEQLVERLQPERSLSHSPLFQVMLVLQNDDENALQLPGLQLTHLTQSNTTAKYDLTLHITERDNSLHLGWEYNTDLFNAATIERLAEHFELLLNGLVDQPEENVFSIEMLPAGEIRQQFIEWNNTQVDYPKDKCVHELFEEQVAAHPNAVAVEFEDGQLSYSELNQKANQLARYLKEERNVMPDTLVGICLERSFEMIVGIIAVLKAGGAYLPLDPSYPAARLAYMLDDADVRTVLTSTPLRELTSINSSTAVLLDSKEVLEKLGRYSHENVSVENLSSENLAYVIYTSGSTGQPKGVMVERGGVRNLVHWYNREYGYSDKDKFLIVSAIGFDLTQKNIFSPLVSGGSVVLFQQEHYDASKIVNVIAQHKVSVVNCAPSLFYEVVNRAEQDNFKSLNSLSYVLFGGEVINSKALATWLQSDNCTVNIVNMYGPTEGTDIASACTQAKSIRATDIGSPIDNIQRYVLNDELLPVPIGIAGQLYISGAGLARGYLNRPELTSEKFIANPFYDPSNSSSSARLYKTGDLVRYLPNSNLEFLGRIDHQVKIRGFRIELGEIEQQLLAHHDVDEAAVVDVANDAGDKRLVAYVTHRDAKAIDADQQLRLSFFADIKTLLFQGLPDYMVPSAFVLLDKLPLTPNGKVDRKGLPAPDLSQARTTFIPPSTETQRQLCEIWQDVLELDQVGISDNFFELGGHSLLVMSVITKAHKRGLIISAKDLFSTSQLSALAAEVDSNRANALPIFKAPENIIPDNCQQITPEMLPLISLSQDEITHISSCVPDGMENIQDIYPLGPLQEGILFTHTLSNNSDPYVLPTLFKVEDEAAAYGFIDRLWQIVERHDALRTAVVWEGLDTAVQVVCKEVMLPVTWLDLDEETDVERHMVDLARPENQWMDLNQAPLLNVRIAENPIDGQHFVLLQFHHLISDHVGLEIIQQELKLLSSGDSDSLPPVVPYRNFIAQTQYQAQQYDAKSYFTKILGDIEEPTAPFDLFNVQQNGTQIVEVREAVPADTAERLREVARSLSISPASIFHAAFGMVIGACSGRENVVFGSVMSGRMQGVLGAESMIGVFINTLPIRLDIVDSSVLDYVLGTQQCLRDLMPFEQASLALTQSCSGLVNDSPLFTAILNYRHSVVSEGGDVINDGSITLITAQERTNYPLTMSIDDFGDGFDIEVQVDVSVPAKRVADYMQTALAQLLEHLIGDSSTPIDRVSVLPSSEAQQLLIEGDKISLGYQKSLCIHQLFEQQAQVNPEAIAVVFEGQQFSYRSLNQKANQLARYLIEERQITPDTLVGICLERSIEMIVGIMGILKAGGAYVPLDPNYPAARLEYMLEDANIATVLTQASLKGQVPILDRQSIYLDCAEIQDGVNTYSNDNVTVNGLDSGHLAYVIYTSGSTGNPKGVLVEHASVVSLVVDNNFVTLDENSILLVNSPISFDAATFEIWGGLLNGGRLVLQGDPQIDANSLSEFISENNITIAWMTSGLFDTFSAASINSLPSLQSLLVGGDVVNKASIIRMKKLNSSLDFINGYGPTENTTFSCCFLMPETIGQFPTIPIGKPLLGCQALVLDATQKICPTGIAGELYLGGSGLARGYLNRPELTNERFISNPFYDSSKPHSSERLYKTGDMVRRLPDGNFEFLGRLDYQVKIRGYRIELGEIEHRLLSHDQVNDAIVMALENHEGDKRLVAYVTHDHAAKMHRDAEKLENESSTLRQEFINSLKATLSQDLPKHMMPSSFVVLQELPLTPNGKVDRNGLPAPDMSLQQKKYIAPSTETESLLCEIWQEVLGLEQIGVADNFFELGGHSLLAMRVIAKAQRLNLTITAKDFFAAPQLAALATEVDNNTAVASAFSIPENIIPAHCGQIAPEMLPLISLTQDEIMRVASIVPGGMKNIQDIYPLGPLQEGILFTHTVSEQSDPYVLSTLFEVIGESEISGFVDNIDFIVKRHDALRTAVVWEGLTTPVQVVCRDVLLPVTWLELDDAVDVEHHMTELTSPENQWMDLTRAPLLSLRIAKGIDVDQYFVLLQFHHLISDHVGLEIIQHELNLLTAGDSDSLETAVPYRNFIAHTRHQAKQHNARAYFTELLGDIDETTAPFGLLNVQGDGTQIVELREGVPAETAKHLREVSRSLNISPASIFHAAFGMVVAACSGRENVVFGSVMSGRLQGVVGAESMLGVFINTLPVRLDLDGTNVIDFILDTQQRLRDLLPFEQAPLALTQSCSSLNSNRTLFSAMLNYRHSAVSENSVIASDGSNDSSIRVLVGQERTNYPFTLSVDDWGKGFEFVFQVDVSINIERVMSYMQLALSQIVCCLRSNPDTPVHDLIVLPQTEIDQQLIEWNDTQTNSPQDRCIHELFEAQVTVNPDAVAVVFEGHQLSYRELNRKANQLAHYLIEERQVCPETLVGICVERSLDMIIGILGILKAGGAYVPLDPNYPAARLAYMLDDSKLTTVLTQTSLSEKLPFNGDQSLALDSAEVRARLQTFSHENVDAGVLGSNHLAYVIYTSGSTGQPKGVMVEHLAAHNYLSFAASHYCSNIQGSVVSTSLNFDATLTSIFAPLVCGKYIQLVQSGPSELEHLIALIQQADDPLLFKLTPAHLDSMKGAMRHAQNHELAHVFVVGGEEFKQNTLKTWKQSLFKNAVFVNEFGPTETTVGCSTYTVSSSDDEVFLEKSVSIGKAISNVHLYVLDRYLKPVPLGVTGELYIGGAGLARGYLARPALTAEKFIDNPFYDANRANASRRLYKTGDLVRYLNDGNLEFLGRIDHQVKVRGFRIELGEIENQLLNHDQVNDAVVTAIGNEEGDKRLVAYVTHSQAAEMHTEDQGARSLRHDFIVSLKSVVSQGLPEHMMPSAFVVLDELPLTPNGKVDRKALPAPDMALQQKSYVAPTTETETQLCLIWQEVLGLEQVGVTDNFFELGGDSLLVMTVIAKAQRLNISITAKDFFAAPQLSHLAAELDSNKGVALPAFIAPENMIPAACEQITPEMLPLISLSQDEITHIASLVPGGMKNIQDMYPLGPLQEGILFIHIMSGESDPYVLPTLFEVKGKSAVNEFIDSIAFIIERHDALRTAVVWEGLSTPVQVVYKDVSLPVTWLDLDDGVDVKGYMTDLTLPENQRMDLTQAPLLTLRVAEGASEGQYYVLLQFHHLISDHVGLEIIQNELNLLSAGDSNLAPVVPYRNFIAHTQHQATQHDARAYFTDYLGDIDEPTAPFGLFDVQGDGTSIVELREAVPSDIAVRLRSISKSLSVSPASLFHAAFGMVVAASSGRKNVVFGSVMSGRLQGVVGAENMLGVFINTLPIRLDVDSASVLDFVLGTQQRLRDLLPFEQASLALTQSCSSLTNDSPLFTAILNYRHSVAVDGNGPSDNDSISILAGQERTNYPFNLSVDDWGDEFDLVFQLDASIDIKRSMAYMQTALTQLLDSLTSSPSTSVQALSVLSSAETQQQLFEWNKTHLEFDKDLCVHELFEQQVRSNPDAVALVFEDRVLSYRELNLRANILAHYLITERGITPDTLVGICVERSLEMIIGILAILKSGGAYLPLDPTYPSARLAYMLNDSKVTTVLTQASLEGQTPLSESQAVVIDSEKVLSKLQTYSSDDVLLKTVKSTNLAYVIYTSGSTGKPKGVMIEHKSAINMSKNQTSLFGVNSQSKTLGFASISFDAGTWEWMMALLNGAELYICEEQARTSIERLESLLISKQISHATLPPAILQAMDPSLEYSLANLIVAGEASSSTLLNPWAARYTVHNAYGPTETTVCATVGQVRAEELVHIGKPLGNLQLYVLGEDSKLPPIGVAGELHVGGIGLARGYLNQPELTADKFIQNPFYEVDNPNSSERLYKTGDWVRYLPDGNLEFIGRVDHQVKIRGFRVELGEIEHHLLLSDGVNNAVVVALTNDTGDKSLVAYVAHSHATNMEGDDVETEAERQNLIFELKASLARDLPSHMVPSAFVILNDLPLTANGKVDHKNLPAPNSRFLAKGYVAPTTDTQRQLCQMWQGILGIDRVGITDSFFEVGGHSLLAMRFISQVKDELSIDLLISDFFEKPTILEISEAIDSNKLVLKNSSMAASEELEELEW